MNVKETLLRHPRIYAAWQAPFAKAKFAPVREENDLTLVRNVLDVGCGPGTSRGHFPSAAYLGVDINPSYLQYAGAYGGGRFVAADVAHLPIGPSAGFDFILVNSLLHHLPTSVVHTLLSQLALLLSPGGSIHVLDLVLPQEISLARWLARMDRGAFARSRAEWVSLLEQHFRISLARSYSLSVPRIVLWNMIYIRADSVG